MRRSDISIFGGAMLASAFSMFPSLTPPEPVRRRHYYAPTPYHIPGRDTVLMDWDLPKGKRAKRRARGRAKHTSHQRAGGGK